MLGGLAILLAIENRKKLIGASAPDTLGKDIYIKTKNYPPIRDIVDIKTLVMGPNKVIAHMKIELNPKIPVNKMDDITAGLERMIIKKMPQVTDCYIEVVADKDKPDCVDLPEARTGPGNDL
jgi:divalent metal cation (Fe/Co/Zn/Cd) transporter